MAVSLARLWPLLPVTTALFSLLALFCVTIADNGIREIRSGADFAAAFADPMVTELLINEPGVRISDADWDHFQLPIPVNRNVTVTGPSPDPRAWPLLDFGGVRDKIVFGPGYAFIGRWLVYANLRSNLMVQAPGVDMLAPQPPGQRALVVLHDAGSVLPLCTEPGLFFEALYSTSRPAAAPGQQMGEAPVPNPPDCVNVTETATGGGAWVPLMQRCYPLRQRYVDVAALTGRVNPVSGTPVPSGYVMTAANVTRLCRAVMPAECVARLGVVGCYIYMLSGGAGDGATRGGLGAAAGGGAAADAGTGGSGAIGDARPALPPEPAESGSSAAAIAGAAVGGAVGGLLLLAAAAVAFVAARRRAQRRRMEAGAAVERSVEGVGSLPMAGQGLPQSKGGGGSCEAGGSTDSVRSSDIPTSSGGPDAMDPVHGPSLHTLDGLQDTASVYLSCLPELPAQRSHPGGPQGQQDTVAGPAGRSDAHALGPCRGPGGHEAKPQDDSNDARATSAATQASSGATDIAPGPAPACVAAACTSAASDDAPSDGAPCGDDCQHSQHVVVTPLTPPRPGLHLGVDAGYDELALVPGARRGRGGFGRVVEGVYRGHRVAVKLMNADWGTDLEAITRVFQQEVEVLARCQHPNVVQLLAACLTPPRLCLVMELMDTSLDRLIHGNPGALLPLPQVLAIAQDVASGLAYLHPTILHRDLKPANILVSTANGRMVAKLTDFGLSRFKGTVLVTQTPAAGTPPYVAPECFDTNNKSLTAKADMYSYGCLLYEMLSGRTPWPGHNMVYIAHAIVNRRLRPPLHEVGPERCPPALRRLVSACWDAVPQRRPAAAEVAKELMALQDRMRHRAGTAPAAAAAGREREGASLRQQVQEPPVDSGRPEQCPHSHAPLHVEPELSVEVL